MYNNTIKYHTPFDAKKARKERAANFFAALGLTILFVLFMCVMFIYGTT